MNELTIPAAGAPLADQDASDIGELYARSREGIVGSMRLLIEAGHRLAAKKASLPHGQWLPWLEANADALGFETRQTAHKLIKCAEKANVASTLHLTPDTARALSREIWGNAARAEKGQARTPRPPRGARALGHYPGLNPPSHPALGVLRHMHREVVRDGTPAQIAAAISDEERAEAEIHARAIVAWLEELAAEVEKITGPHPAEEE